jgi:hypothetical protein
LAADRKGHWRSGVAVAPLRCRAGADTAARRLCWRIAYRRCDAGRRDSARGPIQRGGRRDFNNAFKLAVYSFTPVWMAGVFLVLPGLHFLALLGCYGAYLLWLGLPRLTKVPEDQAANFTAVIVACALALLYIAALAQRLVFGTPGL